MNYLNRDVDRNPVLDHLAHRRHLDWCLRVLGAMCKELPSPRPQERIFMLPVLDSWLSLLISPEGECSFYELVQAVSYLEQHALSEVGVWCDDVPCAEEYDNALTVFEWKLEDARKTASEGVPA